MQNLNSLTRDLTRDPTWALSVSVQRPNHQTTREFLRSLSPVSILLIHMLQLNSAKRRAVRENANLFYCGLFSDALIQSIKSDQ